MPQKFINKIEKKVAKIDNLINNAAGENTKYFTKVTNKDLDDLISVNLKSTFKLTQIFSKNRVQ